MLDTWNNMSAVQIMSSTMTQNKHVPPLCDFSFYLSLTYFLRLIPPGALPQSQHWEYFNPFP